MTSVNQITVKYFAVLRELADKSEEQVQTEAPTALDLYHELSAKYDFHLSEKQMKVAVNNQFCAFDTKLKPGDVVVFIPPVAGG